MNSDMVRVELPQYQPPPPWLPPQRRLGHPSYDNDLRMYLPRTVLLQRRSLNDSLGFNIRGGVEHACGLFISRVMENSEAERLGLREADQVLAVNNISFENIDHSEAVHILKTNIEVEMTIRYFPYGYEKTYDIPTSPQQNASQSPR